MHLGYFFNGDTLFIPSLYKDIFYDDGSFWNWFLPPVFYFFPDMILYLIASLFHDDHYSIIATFGILQISSTIIISYYIFRNFLNSNLSLIFCSFLSIVIIPLVVQEIGVFKLAALSVFHYGATLSALLCLSLFFYFLEFFYKKNTKIKKHKKILFLCFFSVLIGISMSSDKLFILIFILPIFLHWISEIIPTIKRFAEQIKMRILVRSGFVGLTITVIMTGLVGDKAIATEELLLGICVALVLNFAVHYFRQKITSHKKAISSYSEYLAILLIISSIISSVFTKIFYGYNNDIEPLNDVTLGFQKFKQHLETIQGFFTELMQKDLFAFLCITISLVLGFYILINYLFFRLNSDSGELIENILQVKKLEILAWISTGGSLVTVFIVCMGESVEIGDRYIINVFLIPLVALPPLVNYVFTHYETNFSQIKSVQIHSFFICILAILVISKIDLASSILKRATSNKIYKDYYPETIQCLDSASQEYQLKEGISGYWYAKPIYILSKNGITMAQYDWAHKPLKWITSNGWFRDEYDFALVITLENYNSGYNLDRKALIDLNGEPEVVIACPEFDVLAYPTRKLRIEPIEQS
jgi:hypothetical protein